MIPNSGKRISGSRRSNIDAKIEWLVQTVKEMKHITACKKEVK